MARVIHVLDHNGLVHILYDEPHHHTLGETWCGVFVDYGVPALGASCTWVTGTKKPATCLRCIREHEAVFS